MYYDRELKLYEDDNGYTTVQLVPDQPSDRKIFKVHRIVQASFRGKIPSGYVVDHKNNKKFDNRLANLESVTPSENARRSMNAEQRLQREFEISSGKRKPAIVPPIPSDTVWKPVTIERGSTAERFGPFPHYEISNYGHVRKASDKQLITTFMTGSYHTVRLALTAQQRQGGSIYYKSARIHRLVAHAFLPGWSRDTNIVDHKDGKKTNNKETNLEWVSSQENVARAMGRPIQVSVIGTEESRRFNCINAVNDARLISKKLRMRHFIDGYFKYEGVWENRNVMLSFELLTVEDWISTSI